MKFAKMINKREMKNYFLALGVEKIGSYRSEKENVDEDILSLGSGKSHWL